MDIPFERGLIGHSDADVLLHALIDALLGACSAGDIGELFPDTDPANRGRDSAEMLSAALARVAEAGYAVWNVDCIVFAQRPKLSSYKPALRQNLARLLGVTEDCVGVKAKTGELVGPVGREEAVMAQCVALIGRTGHNPDGTADTLTAP